MYEFFYKKYRYLPPVWMRILLSLLFAIVVFIFYFAMLAGKNDIGVTGYLKGGDYIHFYNGGKILLNKNGSQLYKESYFQQQLRTKYHTIGNQRNYKPLYPPPMYIFSSFFALFPLQVSLVIWTTFFLLLYAFTIFLLVNTFRRVYKYIYVILILSFAFPPMFSLFFTGHPSILWAFAFAIALYFSKKDKPFYGGLFLSIFLLKINFWAMIFIILLLTFRPKLFLGFLLGSSILLFITGIWDGFGLWRNWFFYSVDALKDVYSHDIYYRQHSTLAFFQILYSKGTVGRILRYIGTIMGGLALLAPMIYSFFHKRNFSRNSFWMISVIAFVLADPHIYDYDLIVLIVPVIIFVNLMLADHVRPRTIFILIVSYCVLSVLFSALSIFTHLQLSVIFLWFFLVNAVFGKRVRNYMPKNYGSYWETYK